VDDHQFSTCLLSIELFDHKSVEVNESVLDLRYLKVEVGFGIQGAQQRENGKQHQQ
jgi:hypothetical protein